MVKKHFDGPVTRHFTGEFVHPNVIYSMEVDANMRRLSVSAALSEAGSQYSEQHWSRSLESPLRAAVCKPKILLKKVM